MSLLKPLPLLALSLLVSQFALASDQCPNPKPGYPSISFGMTDLNTNDCKTQLNRARWLGFTAVSLSPSFYFQADGTVTPGMDTSVLLACFDAAKALGFDIIYKPMIEAPYTPTVVSASPAPTPISTPRPGPSTLADALMQVPDPSTAPWRAYFDFRPGADYESKAIEPFLQWIEKNQTSGSHLKASLVVATEMHFSLITYPDDWNNLMWNAQQRLKNEGLSNQVEIGIDPTVFGADSWLPPIVKSPLSPDQCTHYFSMLWTADFFSSSVYGDFVAAGFNTNAPNSVGTMYVENETTWEGDLTARGCKMDPALALRFKTGDFKNRDSGRDSQVFWPGELGYAGALNRTWSGFDTDPPYGKGDAAMEQYRETTLVSEQQEFISIAPTWVKAILDHARGSNQEFVSFWITGRFDLFGFSNLPPLGTLDSYQGEYTNVDPIQGPDAIPAVAAIRDTLQQYTKDRCPGWQPMLPTTNPTR